MELIADGNGVAVLWLSTPPSTKKGGGIRNPFLGTPADGITYSVGIQAHRLNGRPHFIHPLDSHPPREPSTNP